MMGGQLHSRKLALASCCESTCNQSISLQFLHLFCVYQLANPCLPVPTFCCETLLLHFFSRMVAASAFCPVWSKNTFSILPAMSTICCCSLFYRCWLQCMAAFYPEKTKTSFFIMPAVWWICMSLNFSSRVAEGSAFCPMRNKKSSSILPVVSVICLLFMVLSKMVVVLAFYL